ncbi:MAG TPA: DPP IV N-terminal domain-containing protein [Thermoanaerobaculia bacterium]|jgi:Tol biopolymer transport system component/C-terminal processing protease CtpA/Prc
MRKLALALLFAATAATTANAQQSIPALAEPSLSPDGREIAFVSGGDIWTVAREGGEARILVSDPAMDSRPMYAPDGKRLAFVSTRSGNGDIYVVDLAGGTPQRITFDDVRDQLDGWSQDGQWLYFHSTSRDIAGFNDVWRVRADGGTPMQVSAERYVSEYFAAPSPDGNTVAFAGRGVAAGQWWRHGSSHIDHSQIWTLDIAAKRYEPLTKDGAREVWPMWSGASTLFFVSDRGGAENIWRITRGAEAVQVTNFRDGRVLWPAIARDGRTIVFERDFAVWALDTTSGQASEVRVALRGVPAAQAVEHRRLNDRFNSLAVAPDGKKLAFVARGEVFATTVKEGGDALRLTRTAGVESQLTWSPDSRTVVYVSDRDGRTRLYQYDIAAEKETQLTSGDHSDDTPRFSPDGKMLAFQRNGAELMVLDLASRNVRSVAKALFDTPPLGSDKPFDWSPDSQWIAYLAYDPSYFRNAHVVRASGGEARQVSYLANVFTDSLAWSADGRFLLMNTGQRTEPGQIARIDLVPITPKFREDRFRDLFTTPAPAPKEETPKAAEVKAEAKPADKKDDKKKSEIVFDGIRDRARFLPVGLDAGIVDVSPDGKWIAFVGSFGDDNSNVYLYSIDELSDEPAIPKQLSASAGPKSNLQFSSDSKEVYYLDAGKIAAATIDPVKARTIATTAAMDVDFAREKEQVFAQTYRLLRDNFYDEKMHGVDWNANRDRIAPRIAAARTSEEMRRVLALMVGELNASHLGVNNPAGEARTNTGRIGIRFDREEYEKNGRLRVSEVLSLSPADMAKIKVGDVIVAVDGRPFTNFDQALENAIDKRVVLTLDGTPRRDVTVRPIRGAAEKALTYRAWVNMNRDYVQKVSGGRLGYVHMPDMGWEALQRLYVDLDAENRARDGVVIDMRNNNGGFVNAYALDVFSRRPYLNMTFRNFPTASARSILGQRSLEKPTVLIVNRHSLSDAEDFTEGYRALGLGKIVGEPTAGWIIYTSNIALVDGTILRLPFIKITDSKGENMELAPRPVDVFVQRPIGETFAGKDAQLDVAVRELLGGLGR